MGNYEFVTTWRVEAPIDRVYDTIEDRDATLASGMTEGAAETWDRLAEYVQTLGAKAGR